MNGDTFSKMIYLPYLDLFDYSVDSLTKYLRPNCFKDLIIRWYYNKMLTDVENEDYEKLDSNRQLAWALWNGVICYKILDPQVDIRELVSSSKEVEKEAFSIIYKSYYNIYSKVNQDYFDMYDISVETFCFKLSSVTISLIKKFDIGNDKSIGSYDYEDYIPDLMNLN